ncbi:hypothetical protein BH11PSE10_BH11PSE10_03570 [soil metagenome]
MLLPFQRGRAARVDDGSFCLRKAWAARDVEPARSHGSDQTVMSAFPLPAWNGDAEQARQVNGELLKVRADPVLGVSAIAYVP